MGDHSKLLLIKMIHTIIGLVLLSFKLSCPLTLVARKYSNSPKDNFDIFLPNWLARYNKVIIGNIFFYGFIIVLIQTLNQ